MCRLKTTKHVQPLGLGWSLRVDVFASTLAYEEKTITVRGETKTYHVAGELVEIEDVGPVRLVVSETDEIRRYYLCTDLDRSEVETSNSPNIAGISKLFTKNRTLNLASNSIRFDRGRQSNDTSSSRFSRGRW